ncbi:hypothetical protein ACLB2K_065416 [Fragaria x ananassa]
MSDGRTSQENQDLKTHGGSHPLLIVDRFLSPPLLGAASRRLRRSSILQADSQRRISDLRSLTLDLQSPTSASTPTLGLEYEEKVLSLIGNDLAVVAQFNDDRLQL